MKKKTVIIIACVCIAVIIASAAVTLYVVMNKKKPQPVATKDQATPTAVTITEAPKGTDVSESAVPSTDPATGELIDASSSEPATQATAELTAPAKMTELLAQGGSSLQQLSDIGCSQLVTVSSSGSSAEISFFSCTDNTWTADDALTCYGFVGRNGVTFDMHEGGNASPFGLYHIGDAFYINNQPSTGLGSFQITGDTYWVDDPDSSHYNRRVEGTADMDWNSAEHMIDIDGYRYGFVIDYNTAAEYNKGSAIFFHISGGPTAGCVGTDESSVLLYLSKLNASANPFILIV